MKNLIVFYLLGTLTGVGQMVNVNDITLSYNDKKHEMVLVMPSDNFYLPLEDNNLTVSIYKEFALKMIVNGQEYSASEPYFEYSGFKRESISFSELTRNRNCIAFKENEDFFISKNTSFKFPNPEKGEYIVEVVRRCGTYVENRKQASLIIR